MTTKKGNTGDPSSYWLLAMKLLQTETKLVLENLGSQVLRSLRTFLLR